MRVEIRLVEYCPIPKNNETKAPMEDGEIVGTRECQDIMFLKLETFLEYLRAGKLGHEVQVTFKRDEKCTVYHVIMKGVSSRTLLRGLKGCTD